jgi:hypothetical protein
VLSAGLLRGDTTEKLGTESEGLFAVEGSLWDAIGSVRTSREEEGIAGEERKGKETDGLAAVSETRREGRGQLMSSSTSLALKPVRSRES